MFTANVPACSMRGQVDDVCATQKRMSGGSSESDVNELAAIPTGSSPSIAVMIVTPVAKCPRTERNCLSSGTSSSSGNGGSGRSARGAQLVTQTVGRREDLGTVDPRRRLARVPQDRVETVVAVRWA